MTQKAATRNQEEYAHEFQQQVTLSHESVDEATAELIACCVPGSPYYTVMEKI